ncbi:hypothetical protein CA13_57820 [Planctomycetes bacterium CA13]|uniref:Tetratricopeptide repeat protein n=1 Tax=Novipirellula herctigrandis TaxID=2527986 RepID=A0A5C5ZAW5_9BACT|nr:hypothetical protein CA13_57820 [Planctomycetes bacterium CA13]
MARKRRVLSAALVGAGKCQDAFDALGSASKLDWLVQQMQAVVLARLGHIEEASEAATTSQAGATKILTPTPGKPFGTLTNGPWWGGCQY